MEFDVRLSRDGHPMVIHDETLERTAGDVRRVSELTVAQLKRLDAGKWKGASYAGERIPTLEETLAMLPPERLLLIELKEGPESVTPVLDVVGESAHGSAQHVFMSFNFETCRELSKQVGGKPILGLVPPPSAVKTPLTEIAKEARQMGLAGLGVSDLWLEKLQYGSLLRRHVFGNTDGALMLSVWTIDHPGRARAWRALGAKLLTTNVPSVINKGLTGRTNEAEA